MSRVLNLRPLAEKIAFTFRALQSRNFRLFFWAGLLSLMGTWIQNLALGWLVYRLTDSAFYLGLVGFAGQIPGLFLTPVAGVYADRLHRRRVLLITQTIPMLLAFLLALLAFTEHINVITIVLIVVVNGIALSFDTPFRHAFLLEMIGDKRLISNAVALNSTLVNTARFLGPSLGGVLVALYGEAVCFFINGFSFLAMIFALLMMRIEQKEIKRTERSVLEDLQQGFRFTWNLKPARYMIQLVIVTSIFGLSFQSFLPVFARDVLQGESRLLGWLTGAVGAGALTGALFLATRERVQVLPSVIRVSAFTFAIGLLFFSLSRWPVVSVILLFLSGFGMITQFSATNTLLQTTVDERMRGRVLSLYSMSFMGFTPLGNLMLGLVSDRFGVTITFVMAALILLLAAVLFSFRLSTVKTIFKVRE